MGSAYPPRSYRGESKKQECSGKGGGQADTLRHGTPDTRQSLSPPGCKPHPRGQIGIQAGWTLPNRDLSRSKEGTRGIPSRVNPIPALRRATAQCFIPRSINGHVDPPGVTKQVRLAPGIVGGGQAQLWVLGGRWRCDNQVHSRYPNATLEPNEFIFFP